ncbi:hypothetical protein ACEPAH_3868 [Sanghuangporus vaninii]
MQRPLSIVLLLLVVHGAFAQLHDVATAAGKLYFGSATDNPELTDTAYVAILSNSSEFGQITPGNSMKWDATEPAQGQFDFTGGQQIVDLAQGAGQIIRGHNCVWYNQLPSWAKYAWDVVNEPFNDDGTWRSDVFYNTLGTDFVPIALKSAREADPNAKLYINDYNIEGEGAKATAMTNLVQQLKSDNVPIDGIGLQSHFIVGEVPTTLQSNMETMTALGVEVAITELDIRMTLPATQEMLEQQATDYRNVVASCNAVPGCIGVTIWDYTDKYSWIPSTFSGQGAACPWDESLQKKPAYDGIIAGF